MEPQARKSERWLAAMCLLLGIQLGINQEVTVMLASVAAKVMLKCDVNTEITSLKWEKENQVVRQWRQKDIFVFKGNIEVAQRSHLFMQQFNQGNCSMRIDGVQMSDAGVYRCTANTKEVSRVQLVLFQMTSVDSQALLVSDNLKLLLDSNPATMPWDASITCKNPKDKERKSWKIDLGQDLKKPLQVENLQLEDNGNWKCKISMEKASLELPFNVMVAGFCTNESGPTRLFSRIDDTVQLSFVFNFNIRDSPTRLRPEVKSGGLYRSDDHAKLGQEKKTLNVSKDGVCWSNECGQRSARVTGSDLSVRLPRVQSDDGGWYTLLVRFTHKELKKQFHLTVLRVSASSKGPVAADSRVALICDVSYHSSETVLRWTQINGSSADVQESRGAGSVRITLQMFPERFGQWRCSLYNGETLLQSADYELVEKRNLALFDWRLWAAGGALALAVLLAIVCAVVCVARGRRRRRRVRRVAWLKQQRTCQCNDKLNVPLHP